jgi:hypothetical protein
MDAVKNEFVFFQLCLQRLYGEGTIIIAMILRRIAVSSRLISMGCHVSAPYQKGSMY